VQVLFVEFEGVAGSVAFVDDLGNLKVSDFTVPEIFYITVPPYLKSPAHSPEKNYRSSNPKERTYPSLASNHKRSRALRSAQRATVAWFSGFFLSVGLAALRSLFCRLVD
jgi:hypothetical protein